MRTITSTTELRSSLAQHRREGKRIAFVPTMGNLHAGHIELVRHAHKQADIVVVSIFVNPMQFGANEDLDNYPRTLTADKEKLFAEGTQYLFFPSAKEIYPCGMENQTRVSVPELADTLCGSSRPGHFTGVATVVSKLFNIVQPDLAFFGKKDFQQLAIIKKMVADLCIPVDVIGIDTARAKDGLALSSRNGYLNEQERQLAPLLQQQLQKSAEAISLGDTDFNTLEQQAREALTSAGFSPDYFQVCDAYTLHPPSTHSTELVIAAAAKLGSTRLIDNITVTLNPSQKHGLSH